MTILEALENALHLLQANGYLYGDVHDDLALSIVRLREEHPDAANKVLVLKYPDAARSKKADSM
jgi:hypothetical protein